jgi:dipeptidyl aminopeptidase/acylaminoacyl peptidase
MKKGLFLGIWILAVSSAGAQNLLTPDQLWSMGRVSALGVTEDGKSVVYKVSVPDIKENKSSAKTYRISVDGGEPAEISEPAGLADKHLSPDGSLLLYDEAVKLMPVAGTDFYPEMEKTSARIYESLHYRHWDTWRDGTFSHVFYRENKSDAKGIDIMKDEPYHTPQLPFGGGEDYIWTPDGKGIVYVCKKKFGTDYARSTNTDLYRYDLATGKTENITDGLMGYDTEPAYSSTGYLAWLSMKRDGYEADKNDILVDVKGQKMNLTGGWDGTVSHFQWAPDGKKIVFIAPTDGTLQLFEVDFPGLTKKLPVVKQLSDGPFDVTGIVGFADSKIIVTRTDFNHATEIFSFDVTSNKFVQITRVNQAFYSNTKEVKAEKRYVTATDGKKMLVWVLFPPDFDPSKKYPALLYCQGGPQSALTQFFSFRWNLALMASQGYIVVAPNRRGMPGHGVEWNEQISRDWGGQVMKDYLTAIDVVGKERYVDSGRMGAVGASFGGYSVFMLAGIHGNRFKTFISHCGVFNTQSMYGTTEEIFFTDWDFGGPYWEMKAFTQKTYGDFNPINYVNNWNAPMLIIQGGKDYRVPEGQAMEAFQAAQLKGLKSRLLHFPDENHWVVKPQNGLVWQREFFKWLKETL